MTKMPDFIDEMPLAEADKRKLHSLGARSPVELLALLNAGAEASRNFLGQTVLNKARDMAEAHLSDQERKLLLRPVPAFQLGANTLPSPRSVLAPGYDIAERDRLFTRMQALKSHAGISAQSAALKEIRELESKLNDMLEH